MSGIHLSPLEWTSISWATGLALAIPTLAFISFHLDYGHFQPLITAASTGVGVFFCLPAGFFKTTKIFIPYIACIILASTVATASHTTHLALMILRTQFKGPKTKKTQLLSSWFSLYATVAGCFGASIIASFIHHMLREPDDLKDNLYSLWIVSIFSGLIWLVGVLHVFFITVTNRTLSLSKASNLFHPCSVLNYPHAIGGLFGVFLSSFTTMCIFTGGVLFIVGQLCIRPLHLLYFWLTYFLFPMFSLPLLHPLQKLIGASPAKMKIMGFLLSLLSSGFGFYFHHSHWKWGHILVFGAIQSTGTGLLHAFGRVLVLGYAPYGKEGAFSVWYAWMRGVGLCLGFTVASVVPGRIKTSFGAAFCASLVGIVVLLFGNVSDVGSVEAGHVVEESSERGSHGPNLDSKESVSV